MTSKIISVKLPYPDCTTTDRIREIFTQYCLARVEIHDMTVYIEFKDQNDIETLDIRFPNLKISQLDGAQIDLVDDAFQWSGKKSSKRSSIEDLSLPIRDNLIVIKNCSPQKIKQFSFQKVKQSVFSNYESINRGIVQGRNLFIQFLDRGEIQKIEADFPGFKVASLGQIAQIDTVDQSYDVKKFAQQWTKQSKKQDKIQSKYQIVSPKSEEKSQKLQKQDEIKDKYLHSQIIPTLDKTTSLEQNFRSSHYSQMKERWEKGTIQVDNLNNQDHKSVSTVFEVEQIQRPRSKPQMFKDPKLKQVIDRIKSKQLDQEQNNKTDSAQPTQPTYNFKPVKQQSKQEVTGLHQKLKPQKIEIKLEIQKQAEPQKKQIAPQTNIQTQTKIKDQPITSQTSSVQLSLQQKLMSIGFFVAWGIFVLTYL